MVINTDHSNAKVIEKIPTSEQWLSISTSVGCFETTSCVYQVEYEGFCDFGSNPVKIKKLPIITFSIK